MTTVSRPPITGAGARRRAATAPLSGVTAGSRNSTETIKKWGQKAFQFTGM